MTNFIIQLSTFCLDGFAVNKNNFFTMYFFKTTVYTYFFFKAYFNSFYSRPTILVSPGIDLINT